MMAKGKSRALLATLSITVLSVMYFVYARSAGEYEIGSDREMAEFTDSSSDAIIDRGETQRVQSTNALDAAFNSAVNAQSRSSSQLDVFSRNVIRRRSDGVTVRFGETRSCERALIFDDDTVVCDRDLYFRLSNAIDLSS